jgi:hypothetical protein
MIAPVLSGEGPLSRSDRSADRAKAGRTGAPGRSMAWWPVERWEALRLALGARGALPREVGRLIPPPRVPIGALAPPTAPSSRAVREGLANLGRFAPRERESLAV